MKRVMAQAFTLVLLTAAVSGADFWQSKPYQKWSIQECHKLLQDSPWSKTYSTQKAAMRPVNRLPGMGSVPGSGEGVSDVGITYYVSFRSAMPVRQAVARQAQIDAKYDKLDDSHKQALDQRLNAFLAATFPDKIVVHVVYGSNIAEWDRQLAFYWQSQTLATLKGTVYLSGPDGDRVEPTDYWVGSGDSRDFEFTFPRNPSLAAQNPDKPLAFEFRHPNVGAERGTRIYQRFQISQMKYGGAVTY